eukprot:TRINITY_DN33643_c0_g1_i1.p1 TRINITY_DN33643_c0_g1~~TRINITY_DN33643_c0_g1_i1.p1  ORF type:complete len:455 (-),score=48.37 TRINITY_DN33643_c0_g1_i1:220-1449(-)
MIKESQYCVASTGAGISTSAGIPDFRGPDGVWTLAAKGLRPKSKAVAITKAVPTPAHMSLVTLMKSGYLKHLISQNVDGLHRKSGIPPQYLSELHGNTNLERCTKCGKEYMRDYPLNGAHRTHLTGNYCSVPGCGGALKDTIINFGENLPQLQIQRGYTESEAADLHLVFGTSLTVRPANDLPRTTARNKDKNGKLVICNLQKTPLDNLATLRIYARCDEVLERVLHILELGEKRDDGKFVAPNFLLQRRVALWRTNDEEQTEDSSSTTTTTSKPSQCTLHVDGVDSDGTPFSLLRSAKLVKVNGENIEPIVSLHEPHVFPCGVLGNAVSAEFELDFYGHYSEPSLCLALPSGADRAAFELSLDPLRQPDWAVQELPADVVQSLELPRHVVVHQHVQVCHVTVKASGRG